MPKSNAVLKPNLGLYLDRPGIVMNPRMLADGYNFRVKEGKLTNLALGWDRFGDFQLNGPVMLINNFLMRSGVEHLIFATPLDIYLFQSNDETVEFLTPRYETGTAAASGTSVTGTGTTWSTNAEAGDYISFGTAGEVDPNATWFEIDSVGGDTSITLVTDAGTVVDGPYTIRKVFSGDIDNAWSTDIFTNASPSTEDEWWATNGGVDDIVRWNGTDDQVEVMSALNFKARVLKVYKNQMIFMNLIQGGTNKPTDMINSDVGAPDDVSSGLSEQFKVMDGTNGIIGADLLGDSLAIYSKDGPILAQFVGGEVVYVFRSGASTIGPVSGKAIANFGNYHEFIGKDSQYLFDGVTVREHNPHIWRDVIRRQDPIRVDRIYHHFDDENGDLIWQVPLTTDPNSGEEDAAPVTAFAEHYLEALAEKEHNTPFSQRSFPFTATGFYFRQDGLTWADITQRWSELTFRWNDKFFFTAFPLNLAGDNDGKVYTINTNQNGDGVALNSFVQFGRRATVDGRARGLVSRIYPFMTQFTNPVNVTVQMTDYAAGPFTITDTQVYDQSLPEGGHFTVHYRRGRFYALRVGTSDLNSPWELTGYDVDIRPGGYR